MGQLFYNTIYPTQIYHGSDTVSKIMKGNEQVWPLLVVVPTVTTTSISSITRTTASSGGNVTNDGGATVTERGICWGPSLNPTTSDTKLASGSGTGIFTSNLTGLDVFTTYHVRAYAINSAGTGYGADRSFTTLNYSAPSITGSAIWRDAYTTYDIPQYSGSLWDGTYIAYGTVGSDNGQTVTERGVCWSTFSNPTTANNKASSGSGVGSYQVTMTGILEGTTYHSRVYAINSMGTSYGPDTQWTTETSISGMGKLYNLWAINNAKNIASSGWHAPTSTEWNTLVTYLGGQSVAGAHLKQTGATHWLYENPGTDNSSGFTALGGGQRNGGTGYYEAKLNGATFGCVDTLGFGQYYASMTYNQNICDVGTNNNIYRYGFSVRLICDSTTDPGGYTGNDGKTYSTIKIGTQVWLAENLRETKYRDTSDIPMVTIATSWSSITTDAWCWYNNNAGHE